jgi:uncharacterized protein YnzC (UPF0291/DUF896 family)
MVPSVETTIRIAELRQKARDGTLTLDEMKEAIAFLRQERLAMPQTSSKPRTKAAPIDPDALLGELGL